MSYDIALSVKVEGCDIYADIGSPELDTPTYNYRGIFEHCMGWKYSQSENVGGEYRRIYYPCEDVLKKVDSGIHELVYNRESYREYEPSNGWGTLSGAADVLQSLRDYIVLRAEEIPIEHLYMHW